MKRRGSRQGFIRKGCHFPDVEEDRWVKGKGIESVSGGRLRGGREAVLSVSVGKGWTHPGGGCANIDSF